jgi:hypothetical protein
LFCVTPLQVPFEKIQSPDEALVDDEMLPPGWQMVMLGSGKDCAYYNAETKETSWERPAWGQKDLAVKSQRGPPAKMTLVAGLTGTVRVFGQKFTLEDY